MVHHGDITRGSWPASTTHRNDFSSPLFPSAFSLHLLLPFPVAKALPPFSVINLVFSLYLYFEILILYQDYKLLGLDGLESWDETNFVTHSGSHIQLVASLGSPAFFIPYLSSSPTLGVTQTFTLKEGGGGGDRFPILCSLGAYRFDPFVISTHSFRPHPPEGALRPPHTVPTCCPLPSPLF